MRSWIDSLLLLTVCVVCIKIQKQRILRLMCIRILFSFAWSFTRLYLCRTGTRGDVTESVLFCGEGSGTLGGGSIATVDTGVDRRECAEPASYR
jgi:hypothetical protein